jgi:hypothetical protein
MRSGEREQNSPRRSARTRQASARARPIALGGELTARGGAGSLITMIGSFGQQQGAGLRTRRAGERLERALQQADGGLRRWVDGTKGGAGRRGAAGRAEGVLAAQSADGAYRRLGSRDAPSCDAAESAEVGCGARRAHHGKQRARGRAGGLSQAGKRAV